MSINLLRTIPKFSRTSLINSNLKSLSIHSLSSNSTSNSPFNSFNSSSPFSRSYSSSSDEGDSTKTRTKASVGPFTIRAFTVFALTGAALYFYFEREKAAVAARKVAETATAKVGRPKIGGPFVLTDQDGKEFSDQDLVGKWSLVYFGFTNCPDICPEELDKMGLVVTGIAKSTGTDILPVFITCDPARDSIAAVKSYVSDFHPSLVGLTGTYEAVKKCCKQYRVYFSTPPNALPTDDYLVDHSIFFYLMDPTGRFVDAFGRTMGEEVVREKVGGYLAEWKAGGGKGSWSLLT